MRRSADSRGQNVAVSFFTIRSTIDCVIANLAVNHDTLILSKDRDLTLIVESKLLALRSMPV